MLHQKIVSAALAIACVAVPAAVPAAPAAQAAQTPFFSSGHWLGHGWSTVTHTGTGATSTSDGSFTFDLTIGTSGLVTGRLVMESSGHVDSAMAESDFDEISSGNGWVLTGSGKSIHWAGGVTITGKITGKRVAMSVPIHTVFQVDGHFEPSSASCNSATGDLALPSQKGFAAAQNAGTTTTYAPWVAFKSDGTDGLAAANDNAEDWFDTMSALDKAVDDDFKGMSKAQLAALLRRAEQVQSAENSFLKCGGNSSALHDKGSKDQFALFDANITAAKQQLAKMG